MLKADLSGRTAIVMGASSGFGAHFTSIPAQEGAHVIVTARRMGALEDLAGALQASGGRAPAIQLHVTNGDSIAAAIGAAPPADILINNAGVTDIKPVLDQAAADYDHIVGIILRGAFLVAAAIARIMRDHRGGTIVNIASLLGLRQAKALRPMPSPRRA